MRVLLTGATGWMGGALGAAVLAAGHELVCLGRDETGERTRASLARIGAGCGYAVTPEALASVVVAPIEARALDASVLEGVDITWHVAAEMSYSPMRLAKAFAFNITNTSALYDKLRRAAPNSRFVYVSTAYTGGAGARPVPEELHLRPLLHNAYLVTKWGAEMALDGLARQPGGLPVMIYRPPGVVGSTVNGWYGGHAYGMYSFYAAMKAAADLGATRLRMDIDPDIAHPYLPIDTFVDHAMAIGELALPAGTTVVHDLGTFATNGQLSAVAGEVLGLDISFGPPESDTDQRADDIIAPNKPFNQGGLRYPYTEGRLQQLLGDAYVRHPLDVDAIRRIISYYRDNPATHE